VQMMESRLALSRRGVHVLAVLATLATFILIASGGLVTSHGVGMSVPDWPTTFGYNMFLFPVSRWVGGVFYEHSHRLIASAVGMITVVLTVWLLIAEPRKWVKVLGMAALVAVILQGVLGGLRVTLIKDELGIFHGMLAQSFFVLLGIISVATSRDFLRGAWAPAMHAQRLCSWMLVLTMLVFLQLGIAATMRHQHAGLSIPDFPAAYGRLLPDTSPLAIEEINKQRTLEGEVPATAVQIWMQMAHRFMALVIFVCVALFAWRVLREVEVGGYVRVWSVILLAMVLVQAGLGAWTIWSNKAADVATAHMALGALMLFVCGRLTFRLYVSNHNEGLRCEAAADVRTAASVA